MLEVLELSGYPLPIYSMTSGAEEPDRGICHLVRATIAPNKAIPKHVCQIL